MPRLKNNDQYHARLVLWGYENLSNADKKRIITWLRAQAAFLESAEDKLANCYVARLMTRKN